MRIRKKNSTLAKPRGGAILTRLKQKCAGFTLIESIIAVSITATGMLSTLSLLTFDRIHNDMEQQRARAHQIICEELERVRLELFSRVTSGSAVTVWDNGTPSDTSDDVSGMLEVAITDPDTGTVLSAAPVPAEMVQMEVTLSWNPAGRRSGKTLRETVATFIVP